MIDVMPPSTWTTAVDIICVSQQELFEKSDKNVLTTTSTINPLALLNRCNFFFSDEALESARRVSKCGTGVPRCVRKQPGGSSSSPRGGETHSVRTLTCSASLIKTLLSICFPKSIFHHGQREQFRAEYFCNCYLLSIQVC